MKHLKLDKHVCCNLQCSAFAANVEHLRIKTSYKHIDDLIVCTLVTLLVCKICPPLPRNLHNYYKIQGKLQLAKGSQGYLRLMSRQSILLFNSGVGKLQLCKGFKNGKNPSPPNVVECFGNQTIEMHLNKQSNDQKDLRTMERGEHRDQSFSRYPSLTSLSRTSNGQVHMHIIYMISKAPAIASPSNIRVYI